MILLHFGLNFLKTTKRGILASEVVKHFVCFGSQLNFKKEKAYPWIHSMFYLYRSQLQCTILRDTRTKKTKTKRHMGLLSLYVLQLLEFINQTGVRRISNNLATGGSISVTFYMFFPCQFLIGIFQSLLLVVLKERQKTLHYARGIKYKLLKLESFQNCKINTITIAHPFTSLEHLLQQLAREVFGDFVYILQSTSKQKNMQIMWIQCLIKLDNSVLEIH